MTRTVFGASGSHRADGSSCPSGKGALPGTVSRSRPAPRPAHRGPRLGREPCSLPEPRVTRTAHTFGGRGHRPVYTAESPVRRKEPRSRFEVSSHGLTLQSVSFESHGVLVGTGRVRSKEFTDLRFACKSGFLQRAGKLPGGPHARGVAPRQLGRPGPRTFPAPRPGRWTPAIQVASRLASAGRVDAVPSPPTCSSLGVSVDSSPLLTRTRCHGIGVLPGDLVFSFIPSPNAGAF